MESFGKHLSSSKTVACLSGLSLAEFSVTEGKKPTPFISLVNPGLESPRELAPKKKNPLHNNCTFSISPLDPCFCLFPRICQVCWTSSEWPSHLIHGLFCIYREVNKSFPELQTSLKWLSWAIQPEEPQQEIGKAAANFLLLFYSLLVFLLCSYPHCRIILELVGYFQCHIWRRAHIIPRILCQVNQTLDLFN